MTPDAHRTEAADKILAELTAMLVAVVGEELLIAAEVTRESRFNEDLAIESIEFVALAELLQERYGESVDFVAFLADLDIDAIMAMDVGSVVDHIVTSLDVAEAAGVG